MIKVILLAALACLALGFKPCEPFGPRLSYGQVLEDSSSDDRLSVYFNTKSQCKRSYLQVLSASGVERVECILTTLKLSHDTKYDAFIHKCKITSFIFQKAFYYNMFGWDGSATNPTPFSTDFIPVKLPDVTNHRRKVTLIVLADWSFLETDKYTPLYKLFADITSKHEIHGLLINGDIGYDLQTNNCHNYETFLVMLGSVTKSIPLIFATGNHEYASDDNYELFRQSFQMYHIDTKFASGLAFGSAFLAPFDPFVQVYEEVDVDPALENFKAVLAVGKDSGRFIVSSSHYPMACSGSDENCVDIPRKLKLYWQALFSAGAKLYFGAHDHSYQRMFPYYKNGTFSTQLANYRASEEYIISFIEGVAGNDESMVEEIEVVKPITASYTVNETGFGLLDIDETQASYSHFSTKRGLTDHVRIERTARNLNRN